eukprot:CAMPEP_0197528378 /NCGR_PEP_ID=MMETSP1318-20131121/24869_1 /TAXON_ID=552666 /ORGANISM="Partenskyella glossopodia, Strain RCC365" /LENGTH=168 /DNA_ID=CAMNT_0043083445 /DNA_START=342 /DNA_END=848 /DNA_ORIENTATION=-
MATYITQELPGILRKEFPFNGKMSITGHSMGGHGALVTFLRNPGMFVSCSAFAPICNPINCPWGQKAFSGYLGSDKKSWENWDATELMKKYNGPKTSILIDQGVEDGFYKQKQLLPEAFVAACKQKGHPVICRMQEGYDHSYYFVSTFMADHVWYHADMLYGETKYLS